MKATIIQLNTKSADVEDNSEKIKQYINEGNAEELIIFPMLSITGINCCDYFKNPEFIEKQNSALEEITELSKQRDIILGIAEKTEDGLYNSIAILSNGKKKILR